MSLPLLRSLCLSNQRILQHKLLLFESLERSNHLHIFQQTCPLIGASMGQHLRHSNDHMEIVIKEVSRISRELIEYSHHESSSDNIQQQDHRIILFNYDVRKRGSDDETILHSAKTRIRHIQFMLETIVTTTIQEKIAQQILERPVWASFLLSAEAAKSSAEEMPLLISNIGRELSFVAHHALHHLALIKIIGLHMKAFSDIDLPADFGKAPSTVQYKAIMDQQNMN